MSVDDVHRQQHDESGSFNTSSANNAKNAQRMCPPQKMINEQTKPIVMYTGDMETHHNNSMYNVYGT